MERHGRRGGLGDRGHVSYLCDSVSYLSAPNKNKLVQIHSQARWLRHLSLQHQKAEQKDCRERKASLGYTLRSMQ